MTVTAIARLVQIHKALGHPARLRLLAALRSGPLCGCQMAVVVKLAASTISEHLAELRKAGLITDRKEGRWVEYRLSDAAVRDGILEPLWPMLDGDAEAKADAVLLEELRKVPLDELCGVDLDVRRLGRPRLATAAARADRMRCSGVSK
jgi:DNA-binding transcriptional ArsR family regulator